MNLGGTVHVTKTGCCVLLGFVIILTLYLLPRQDTQQGHKSDKVNLNQLLAVAVQAAELGGKQVVDSIGHHDLQIISKGKTKEGANDTVTSADYHSHCVMTDTIRHFYPNIKVISEENTRCPSGSTDFNLTTLSNHDTFVEPADVTVWIDPLDATQEYTEKLTDFVTTMVCVAVRGQPVIGVIHRPFVPATYWAWVGHARSTNLAIKSNRHGGDSVKFVVSRSHTGQVRSRIEDMFAGRVGEIVPAGGAGYKVLQLVAGEADAYVHATAIKKWDVCAGNAILKAVGGGMRTLRGNEIDYAPGDALNEEGIIGTIEELGVNFE